MLDAIYGAGFEPKCGACSIVAMRGPSHAIKLPLEILEEIFTYLDQKDWFNAAQVCSSWQKVANPLLYRSPKPVFPAKLTNTLESIPSLFNLLAEFDTDWLLQERFSERVVKLTGSLEKPFLAYSNLFTNLQKVDIKVESHAVLESISALPRITHLSLDFTRFTYEYHAYHPSPHCEPGKQISLHTRANNRLQHIRLRGILCGAGEIIHSLPQSLISFSLAESDATGISFYPLSKLKRLSSFKVIGCRAVTDESLHEFFWECRSLKHICLKWTLAKSTCIPPQVLESLFTLELDCAFSDVIQPEWLMNAKQLQSLVLWDTSFQASGMMQVLASMKHLHHLKLSNGIDQESVESDCLPTRFDQLETLDLSFSDVNDMDVYFILKGSAKLRELRLKYCRKIQDVWSIAKAARSHPCMRLLDMRQCLNSEVNASLDGGMMKVLF